MSVYTQATTFQHILVALMLASCLPPLAVGIARGRSRVWSLRKRMLFIGAPGSVQALACAAFLIDWSSRGRPWAELRLAAPEGWAAWLGVAVGLGWLTILAVALLPDAASARRCTRCRAEYPMFATADRSAGQRVLVVLLAVGFGVIEELVFRGILQWYAERLSHPWIVMPLLALLFGAMHVQVNPGMGWWSLVFGLAAGALTLACGSLWPAVIAHVAQNGIVIGIGVWASARPAAVADCGEHDKQGATTEHHGTLRASSCNESGQHQAG